MSTAVEQAKLGRLKSWEGIDPMPSGGGLAA